MSPITTKHIAVNDEEENVCGSIERDQAYLIAWASLDRNDEQVEDVSLLSLEKLCE